MSSNKLLLRLRLTLRLRLCNKNHLYESMPLQLAVPYIAAAKSFKSDTTFC